MAVAPVIKKERRPAYLSVRGIKPMNEELRVHNTPASIDSDLISISYGKFE
jgi:hypothetical protein